MDSVTTISVSLVESRLPVVPPIKFEVPYDYPVHNPIIVEFVENYSKILNF